MKKVLKRISVMCVCLVLLAASFLTPVAYAASDVYELAFDNLFIFEQWVNHANFKVHAGDGSTTSTLTTNISNGSFVLTNNSTNEVYTPFSMSSVGAFYSMPVEENTEYTISYVANGTTTSFEVFVFYFNKEGQYTSHESTFAYQYGQNEWTFKAPEGTGYIQVRFDNNSPQSNVTVSDIKICPKEIYDVAKNYAHRKAFTYTAGAKYGELPAPQREGLVFAGWYTDPDGKGKEINADTVMDSASYALYSKWDPVTVGNLELVSLPVKQNYCVGEKLNTTGLIVGVTYPDGTKENIDEGFRCSPSEITKSGTQTITVSYGNSTAEFQVNASAFYSKSIVLNNKEYEVKEANNTYTLDYSGSSFNQYVIKYSSDAYVKGEISFNGVVEEFFLEPAQNGTFSGYIDGFLDGKTQTQITSVVFTPLDKKSMDFTLSAINANKATNPAGSDGMVYLSDEKNYKIGIDLDWGGALSYLEDLANNVVSAKSNKNTSAPTAVGFYDDYDGTYKEWFQTKAEYTTQSKVNLINANDTGRLVQQSYYGTGSYPYEIGDYNGVPWNYNPVQGGNVKNEPSKIVDLKITETESYSEIYVKCRPLDWGKYSDEYAKANGLEKKYGADYITPSYMEAWYTLENGMMRATCRFVDYSGYPSVTTTQELPAFYCVEPLNNFVYYSGGEPWSDSNTKVTKSDLVFWGEEAGAGQNFYCNENWAAYIGAGADSFGIGLYCPGQTNMFTGVFNRGGCNSLSPATEGPTSYIAAVDTLYFQSYTPISYCYYIKTGNVDTIRSSFKAVAQSKTDICNATSTNGFCDMCGKYIAPEADKNGVYQISNAGELHWFSDYVNSGNVNANAVLLCDITDNSGVLTGYGALAGNTAGFRKWTPIGNASNKYNGHFDGQGFTINGLFMDASAVAYGGLFGYTGSSAVVEEVGVDYSFLKGGQYVGGIAGRNEGTINNCYCLYTITMGDSYVGGVVGYNNGTVKNCYNAGIVSATSYVGGVAGTNTATISNCYYLKDVATDGSSQAQNGIGKASGGLSVSDIAGATAGKSVEELASGEVAYLLQSANSEQIWGQKTNISGSAPVFDKDGAYKVGVVENEDNYVLADIGDIIKDDEVNVYDYQQLVNQVLSEEKLDFEGMLSSDIDGDGYLDVIDCSLMQLIISGKHNKVDVYLKGDLDFDGTPYTKEDIAAIKKAFINQDKLNTRQKYACDLNLDGALDAKDRELLLQQDSKALRPIFSDIEESMAQRNTPVNVIILAGQSNAYGASPLTQEVRSTVGNTDFSNIKIKYTNINSADGTNNWSVHYANSDFETYRLGIGGQADAWFGPELGVAYHLATNDATKDQTWYIIKTTAAGTYLGGNWLYDTTGKYYNATNSENIKNDLGVYLADGMINLVGADLAAIANKHGANNVNIRAFMWMQGESDACVQQWADQYGELQNILVNRVRTELGGYDKDGNIPFVDGAIAAYKNGTNMWTYSDTVNTAKANNATHWYVPQNTSRNVINKTAAGLYANDGSSTTKLTNSIWIDTSTCKSKLENGNENGENDGAHYCGESMLRIGIWFAQGMLIY